MCLYRFLYAECEYGYGELYSRMSLNIFLCGMCVEKGRFFTDNRAMLLFPAFPLKWYTNKE